MRQALGNFPRLVGMFPIRVLSRIPPALSLEQDHGAAVSLATHHAVVRVADPLAGPA